MSSILDFWPIESPPRPNQIVALEWIAKQDSKYIILEAPVGSGKSLIGVTASRWMASQSTGNSFILTPQRILQKQYEREFIENPKLRLKSLYGRSNYKCKPHKTNCGLGGKIKPKCEYCPQEKARNEAMKSSNVVMNYDLALLHFAHSDVFDKRKLMICDEAHVLERILTEFDALHITSTYLPKIGIKWKPISDMATAYDWVRDEYLPALRDYVQSMESEVERITEDTAVTPDDLRVLKDYDLFAGHLDDVEELSLYDLENLEKYFVLVHDKLNIKFKRLTASTSFRRYLNHQADKFLFMSSTILNHEGFCKDLGIELSEVAFLSLDSEFSADNRPVYYMPQMKMNVSWKKPENAASLEQMAKFQNKICEQHKDESGIIHTASFQIAEWVVANLDTNHKVFHHNPDSGDDRNSIINAFQDYPRPSILVSPSITEGLDLYEDLARFAIVTKVPFPYLGDQWINTKKNFSTEWYQRQALVNIIQGGGRIVRSKEDHGNVYILDGSWGYLYSQTQHMVPKWWKDSYQVPF